MAMDSSEVDIYSFANEKEIARSFSKRFQWEMILIGVGQAVIFLSLWPLVILDITPLWIGAPIACLCSLFAYLPSHEAQHGNYSRGKASRRWIDSFVSHVTLITLMLPHHILRATHMKHHAYTNNPDKDVDYDTANCNSLLEVLVMSQLAVSKYEKFLEVFKDDNNFIKSFEKGMIVGLGYRATLMILVLLFPLEALFLWWIPSKIGVMYLSTFFSWYPHFQMETGRYKDTRFWSHMLPRYINHSMQLHFIHHLHPGIGHYDEPMAIEALKPFLIAKGVPGADQIPDRISYNPLIKF